MTSVSTATPPLTGGQFLAQAPDQIFTVEDFGSDENLMIQAADDFSRGEILPIQDRIDAQEPGLMPKLIRQAGELGFCGADTPEPYGGLGLPKNLAARMLEFLSLNASFSVTVGITSGISQVGLTLFGTEELKKKYLPRLTSGEQIGAYCLSEPNSGTDALSMTTRADEKDGKWILNGTKMWISNAQWADQFLVMGKIGGEKVTAFLVERDFPGVSISREEHKLGLKGSSTARVLLENCEVPLENMVYEAGRGHVVAFNALNLGRFKLASMSIGPARQALIYANAYAQDRRQFGAPISSFGLIEEKFARMAAHFYASESAIYRTGALIDEAFDRAHADTSLNPVQRNLRGAEEFAIECSLVKVLSTEAEALIVDDALQVYGGYGFTEEFPIARIYRDCRVSRIYEGTNEINRFFIADRVLRKHREGLFASAQPDSWVGGLALEALRRVAAMENPHQSVLGALADLLIFSYAEQSARLRSSRRPDVYVPLARMYAAMIQPRAATAFQVVTGEAVSLPAPEAYSVSEIAAWVYQTWR